MIPKITHQTARTTRLSWEEARLTKRLRNKLRSWEHHLWDDADNAALVARLFPQYSKLYDAIPFGVAKADIARCAYLYAYGGFYFDTDFRLLRAPDGDILDKSCVVPIEKPQAQHNVLHETHVGLGNACLGSAPEYPFWKNFISFIFESNRPHLIRHQDQIIGATGPDALTSFYMTHAYDYPDLYLAPKNQFNPDISIFALRSSADADTYGVHLHWGSWRKQAFTIAARRLLRRKINGLVS